MIVSKCCQPLLTAKAAFAGGSGKTSQILNWIQSISQITVNNVYLFEGEKITIKEKDQRREGTFTKHVIQHKN